MRQHREELVLLAVRDAQRVLGVAPLRDVDRGAHVTLELAVVSEPRRRVRAHPAVLAVVPPKPELCRESRLRRERAPVRAHVLLAILGVHVAAPIVAAYILVGIDAGELDIGAIDELTAVGPVDPEQHG